MEWEGFATIVPRRPILVCWIQPISQGYSILV